jgi:hypothetical protein
MCDPPEVPLGPGIHERPGIKHTHWRSMQASQATPGLGRAPAFAVDDQFEGTPVDAA